MSHFGRFSIASEAERLAAEGVKEINLISQDTINYGVDLGMRGGLTILLRALVKVKDIRWIRPFYLYPLQVTDDLLDLYAGEEKITKYIDMPLQHINDRMLERMHRLGTRATINKLVDRNRTRILDVTFRTALTGLDSVRCIRDYFEQRAIDLGEFEPDHTLAEDADGRKAAGAPRLMRRGRDEFLIYHPNAAADEQAAQPNRSNQDTADREAEEEGGHERRKETRRIIASQMDIK